MRVTIDAVGRIVIPKALREELGVDGPAELDLRVVDGCLELTVPDVSVRMERRQGLPVLVAAEPVRPLTAEQARAAIDRVRR